MELVAGRYRLESVLGPRRWRAYDLRLEQQVAVLRHPPEGSGPDGYLAQVALREVGICMRVLRSPHIVVPTDVVEHDGFAWIVTDMVDGRTLAEAVAADGPLAPPVATRVARCLLQALVAAHAVGVPHGGIRPPNVLLPTAGGARLTGFGLDRLEPSAQPTTLAERGGYLSPEQVVGESASAAGDLFSVASTLYFALEGRPPYQAASPPAAMMAIFGDPPDLTGTSDLGDLLRLLWTKDPRGRPTAAEALAIVS